MYNVSASLGKQQYLVVLAKLILQILSEQALVGLLTLLLSACMSLAAPGSFAGRGFAGYGGFGSGVSGGGYGGGHGNGGSSFGYGTTAFGSSLGHGHRGGYGGGCPGCGCEFRRPPRAET